MILRKDIKMRNLSFWLIPLVSLVAGMNNSECKSIRESSNSKVKIQKKQSADVHNIDNEEEKLRIRIDDEPYDNANEFVIEQGSGRIIEFSKDIGHVFIADPTVMDVNLLSKRSFEIVGLKRGRTRIRVDDKNNKIMLRKDVSVSFDLSKILSVIYDMFPNNNVSVVNFDTSIVLKGEVESPKVALDIMDTVSKLVGGEANVVNNMTIGSPAQVMLKVKIAKVYREITKSLGINWRNLSLGSGLSAAIIGGSTGGTLPLVLGGVSAIAKTSERGSGTSDLTNTFDTNNGIYGKQGAMPTVPLSKGGSRWIIDYRDKHGTNIGGVIDALADESLATVLAEPTLVALSGETAKFTSGGEEPYKNSSTGSNSTTTQFKEWGIILDFTPTVLSGNRIRMKVKPEVSALENASVVGGEKPLSKQSVETTVELGSGQSLAIAGLIKKEKSLSAAELPGLSKIPLLGSLFRSSNNSLKETELVIIVTPYIVKPSSKQLMTPVDNLPKMLSPCDSNIYKKFYLTDEDEETKAPKKCENKCSKKMDNCMQRIKSDKAYRCRKITEHSGFTIS